MKGAVDAVAAPCATVPPDLQESRRRSRMEGGTPLAVIDNDESSASSTSRTPSSRASSDQMLSLRRAGIRTVMITGDNRLTAATIAAEAGVEDFVPEAKPEDKIRLIREEQGQGRLVAMTGDGTNDAPALWRRPTSASR